MEEERREDVEGQEFYELLHSVQRYQKKTPRALWQRIEKASGVLFQWSIRPR